MTKLLFVRQFPLPGGPTLLKGFKLPFTPFRGLVIKEGQVGPPARVLSWEVDNEADFFWDPQEDSFICLRQAKPVLGDVAQDVALLKQDGWMEYPLS